MLAECLRKEKEANIKPDPDVDIFIKVMKVPKFSNANKYINRSWVILLSCYYNALPILKNLSTGAETFTCTDVYTHRMY